MGKGARNRMIRRQAIAYKESNKNEKRTVKSLARRIRRVGWIDA